MLVLFLFAGTANAKTKRSSAITKRPSTTTNHFTKKKKKDLKSKGLKRIIWLTKFEIDFLNLKLAIDVIIFITILLFIGDIYLVNCDNWNIKVNERASMYF